MWPAALVPRATTYSRLIALQGKSKEEELASLLARTQGLGPLSEQRAMWLASRVPDMHFEQGQVLWGPAQGSLIIFVLLEGRVRLFKTLDGAEITLETVQAGELFGDVSALAGRRRGTYAEALEPSRVAMLSRRVLNDLVREEPEMGMRLAEELAARLYEYRERMADVALKQVPARLASLLLRLFEAEGVVGREGTRIGTRYTHEQFAAMIGAKRVAVSRAMGQLRELEAIESRGRWLYLKDEAALQRAAVGAGPPKT
jgi:CRP/FNR family transcriptional regulator, cyclic AMP receptor protein